MSLLLDSGVLLPCHALGTLASTEKVEFFHDVEASLLYFLDPKS